MSDGVEDVLEVIGQQIEERFQLPLHELGAAIAAAPERNAAARDVMHGYGLLAVSQSALERSEKQLLDALGRAPGELTDTQMDLAQRVNAAVTARDERAIAVRQLLELEPPSHEQADRHSADRTTARGPVAPARPAPLPPRAGHGRSLGASR